jgi:predicted nucleic acid-binding protein
LFQRVRASPIRPRRSPPPHRTGAHGRAELDAAGDRITFHNALVVAAAFSAACDPLDTEDLQQHRRSGSLTVVNPLAASA